PNCFRDSARRRSGCLTRLWSTVELFAYSIDDTAAPARPAIDIQSWNQMTIGSPTVWLTTTMTTAATPTTPSAIRLPFDRVLPYRPSALATSPPATSVGP